MTVTGSVSAAKLGKTLVAETVLGNGLEAREHPSPLYPELWDQPVTLDALGRLRRDIWSSRTNWDLTDSNLATAELSFFREAGGGAIVNAPYGEAMHATDLVQIAEKTGVHIIAGLVPGLRARASRDKKFIISQLVSEARSGVEGSSIHPGILGPIEVDQPDNPDQILVLQSALQAAEETGLALLVRCPPTKLNELVILALQNKARGSGVILDVDVVPDPSSIEFQTAEGGAYGAIRYARVLPDGLLRAAENGFYLAFASFGFEVYDDRARTQSARDPQRILGIAHLIERGHLHQILLSQGVRLKTQLHAYGSWGYDHVLKNIVPMMERNGFAPKQITTMLMWNPARALSRT